MRAINMKPFACLPRVDGDALLTKKMTILRCYGVRLLVAAFLALPFATRANGAPFAMGRAESNVDVAVKSTLDSCVARLGNVFKPDGP
jgi:hypothetical protein